MPENQEHGVLAPNDLPEGEENNLWKQNMSVTIREELGDGAEGTFGKSQNLYDRVSFNNGQLCSGLVYGSVQSGKTFSMLGVSALKNFG